MKEIDQSVADILREAAESERVEHEFGDGRRSRYRALIDRLLDVIDEAGHKRTRSIITATQIVAGAIGPPLGYLLRDQQASTSVAIIAWASWFIVMVAVVAFSKVVPEDAKTFRLEIVRLKLTNICEDLAARLALFDLLPATESVAQSVVTERISEFLSRFDDLDNKSQTVLRRSLNSEAVFERGLDSAIHVPLPNLPSAIEDQLHIVTSQIAKVSQFVFGGKDLTAKLYLRGEIEVDGRRGEILVAFSRYPPSHGKWPNGASWAWHGASKAIVCRARATGGTEIGAATDYNQEFDSVIAMCLPSRIGVLAITLNEKPASAVKVPKSTAKAFTLAAQQLLVEALDITTPLKVQAK